jgi:hypothetical protein
MTEYVLGAVKDRLRREGWTPAKRRRRHDG